MWVVVILQEQRNIYTYSDKLQLYRCHLSTVSLLMQETVVTEGESENREEMLEKTRGDYIFSSKHKKQNDNVRKLNIKWTPDTSRTDTDVYKPVSEEVKVHVN